MNTLRFISTLFLIAYLQTMGVAQARLIASESDRTVGLPREAIETYLAEFFNNLNGKKGVEAVESLRERFRLDSVSTNELGARIDELVKTFGRLDSTECLGWAFPARSRRLGYAVFLTHHSAGPALWEVLVHGNGERWKILKMKFTTEDLFDQMRSLGMTETTAPER